ncbi:uncharacterized protein LOC131954073 isoform X2 [Physella acuta]|uniref:uncharacterized protein LOC131954073 isoform X2 n=1 Tax=Physella acuta TaxID=109671 RepID=UPI0027DE604D|nr:uncharacterized protein LOC131954073 isoform X2 [Physella acuta]
MLTIARALCDIKFGDTGRQDSGRQAGEQNMANPDPWDPSLNANRRPSNCSFSRVPHAGPGPAPPLVVIGADEDFSRTDSGGSLAGNVSGDDTDRWRGSLSTSYSSSPSTGRMKMKDLGLSHASSAMRFRLTFDESADAAANNNIELPFDVAPPALSSKRPSCICGEPELPPPADCFSHFADTLDSSSTGVGHPDPGHGGSGSIPFETPESHMRNSYSPNVPSVNTTYAGSPDTCPPHATIPHYTTPHIDHSAGYLNLPGNHGNMDAYSDDYTNSSRVQTQLDAGHPKVTICISNSQQSFIPFTCDSPTLESAGEENYQLNDFLTHNNNNHPYIKDSGGYPDMCTTGYTSYHQHYHDADYGSGLANGHVQPEEIRLLSRQEGAYLQHQDTVSAPPIQDLYRYHVFFSHCPEDREWVEHMVSHLEAPPFNYTCAYASAQDEADPSTLQQRILCAAMLSERVVLVLSHRYVEETWFSFEKTLKQLTQMSLHNQRIMGVLLEDCQIPESLGELYFLDSSDPDFFLVFTKRLKTSRIPRSSASVSSDLGQTALTPANVTNGKILTFCRLQIKVGWDSFLNPADGPELDIPPSLSAHGIGMEKTEFGEIVTKVSGIIGGSNKLPWLLSAQPLAALLLAGGLWLPAFIAVLVVHVDDASGIALPVRLAVFLFPLGLVATGYLIKWRRAYWLTKIVRLLVQNCVDVNQALYFQGRPLFVTAAHVRANIFAIYFVYFDATDCVRSVDLLLFACMEDDWEKLIKLITFYTRDEHYLSRMSISERLTVMMSAPYLVKLVRQVLPHPPQQRHVSRLLCLCQFTEECISRFAHGLDREDVPGLAELFTRHMPGKVSGSAVRRVQEELFHANHGLVP